ILADNRRPLAHMPPVLAVDLDIYMILPLSNRTPFIVAPVPDDVVFARRTGGTGEGADAPFVAAVGLPPGGKLGDVFVVIAPDAEVTDDLVILIFDPDGHIRAL